MVQSSSVGFIGHGVPGKTTSQQHSIQTYVSGSGRKKNDTNLGQDFTFLSLATQPC